MRSGSVYSVKAGRCFSGPWILKSVWWLKQEDEEREEEARVALLLLAAQVGKLGREGHGGPGLAPRWINQGLHLSAANKDPTRVVKCFHVKEERKRAARRWPGPPTKSSAPLCLAALLPSSR